MYQVETMMSNYICSFYQSYSEAYTAATLLKCIAIILHPNRQFKWCCTADTLFQHCVHVCTVLCSIVRCMCNWKGHYVSWRKKHHSATWSWNGSKQLMTFGIHLKHQRYTYNNQNIFPLFVECVVIIVQYRTDYLNVHVNLW